MVNKKIKEYMLMSMQYSADDYGSDGLTLGYSTTETKVYKSLTDYLMENNLKLSTEDKRFLHKLAKSIAEIEKESKNIAKLLGW